MDAAVCVCGCVCMCVCVRQLLATIPAARKLQMYDVGAGVLLRELEDPQDGSTGRQRRAAYQVTFVCLGTCWATATSGLSLDAMMVGGG